MFQGNHTAFVNVNNFPFFHLVLTLLLDPFRDGLLIETLVLQMKKQQTKILSCAPTSDLPVIYFSHK